MWQAASLELTSGADAFDTVAPPNSWWVNPLRKGSAFSIEGTWSALLRAAEGSRRDQLTEFVRSNFWSAYRGMALSLNLTVQMAQEDLDFLMARDRAFHTLD